jgi:hypothetical protein
MNLLLESVEESMQTKAKSSTRMVLELAAKCLTSVACSLEVLTSLEVLAKSSEAMAIEKANSGWAVLSLAAS